MISTKWEKVTNPSTMSDDNIHSICSVKLKCKAFALLAQKLVSKLSKLRQSAAHTFLKEVGEESSADREQVSK